MKVRYFQLIGVVLIAVLLLLGCAAKKKVQSAPKDPAVLYTKGIVLFNDGKYKDAIDVFTRLKEYFPSDELYAPKADIRIADCYFFQKEYPEAVTRYMEFKKQQPFHPDVPYAEYQVGLCHYRQVLSKDRDQKATVKAMTAFQNVVANYPDTIFAQKSREKIIFCQRRLAENELCVAQFYLRKGKYAAAEKRAASTLMKYPGSGVDDEALYYLALALHKQQKDPEALTPVNQLIQDYPQSPFAREGKKLLASLKLDGMVATSTGSREVVMRKTSTLEKEGVKSLPFKISADSTKNMLEKNSVLYTGNVVALGEDVTIRAESLMLTMGPGNVAQEMVVRKEVVVKTKEQEFFCKKAVWSAVDKTLVMTEDAKIRGIGEWIRGEQITLHLDTGRVEITGQKVEMMQEGARQK